MLLTLAFAGATFLSTMGGGLAAIHWSGRAEPLLAIAGGVVLGAALFDLLPEAADNASSSGVPTAAPFIIAITGYLLFRLLERQLHRQDHQHGPDRMGVAGAAGFTVHSFFDGLAIGLGFQLSQGVGVVVALAVIGHDFSDGLNTVSYLVAHGYERRIQLRWLAADAIAPLVGATVAALAPVPDEVFPIALGFFSGVFIYAATSNLLPRALEADPKKMVPLAAFGMAMMFTVSRFA